MRQIMGCQLVGGIIGTNWRKTSPMAAQLTQISDVVLQSAT